MLEQKLYSDFIQRWTFCLFSVVNCKALLKKRCSFYSCAFALFSDFCVPNCVKNTFHKTENRLPLVGRNGRRKMNYHVRRAIGFTKQLIIFSFVSCFKSVLCCVHQLWWIVFSCVLAKLTVGNRNQTQSSLPGGTQ